MQNKILKRGFMNDPNVNIRKEMHSVFNSRNSGWSNGEF